MKILIPFGTRPEIVKLAPVAAALREAGIGLRLVATGQHYDRALAGSFFADLGLDPDERWQLPDGEADRVGAILSRALAEVAATGPDLVLLLGDTYTVPLFCLAARRHGVPVAHLEAGLRSFNPTSMEEVNRKVAAATASIHLAPTDLAANFLRAEGVTEARIAVVGNPVLDVLRARGLVPSPVGERAGVLLTAHRPTNVDDPDRLAAIVEIVERLAAEVGPVTFPVHPRTQARLAAAGLTSRLDHDGITACDPLPYDEMLAALQRARVVVTDSGGLQEEASWLGVPVVVLRHSTPRWEGVALGTSVLTGLDVERAVAAAAALAAPDEADRVASVPCPYGDGFTGPRVARLLLDPGTVDLLRLDEPDFVGREPPS